jgi:Carboxypeptidase regulatory-like domain
MRVQLADGPRRTMEELQRFGGVVRDGDGSPVADAWIALPDLGRMTSSDRDGRFTFDGMRPGDHRVSARTASGDEASGVATVPGGGVDLELGSARRKSASKRG